ncbi:MAG: electron transfer flavoprotein subunit beta [Bacteroidetes bacterium GWA2_30_7]|nr:MAG: electron transfer flavoprotein subunit beta [Bacteroidetes bacterium GWA2_30_7]
MKGLKIIVLAKQVPDTRNVGKDAMKADGTVNRGALAAVFNPEDLNALEQALRLKEKYAGSTITMLTMGPGRAAELIREGLYHGIDNGILISDRKFAGSDTLATSYTLALAIKKLDFDVILAGRQAIDGDTAQVGPQVAEKLNIPQITYAEEIIEYKGKQIIVKRRLEKGIEIVSSSLPVLITVHSSAQACRPRNSKLFMKYKHAKTIVEVQDSSEDYIQLQKDRPYLTIQEISCRDLNPEDKYLGLTGSPTKVKKIENVVFKAKESKVLTSDNKDIESMMKELLANHTIG